MFNLLLVTNLTLLGVYADLPSCQNAIYQIHAQKIAPPPVPRTPAVENVIREQVRLQTGMICVPTKN